jgi:LPXTG-motif cell wall-anchored protein
MRNPLRTRAAILAGAVALVGVSVAGTANADPISAGTAKAFGITAQLGGEELIPPTPTAETVAPPFADDTNETAIPIPADPLAVNGTLIAQSAVHQASDLPSVLEQAPQSVAGPYNARAIGEAESLEVLIDEGIPGGRLVDADLITGEAVAVCSGGTVQYSASSEVVNLQIGGEDPLSGPLNDLIDEISAGINDSGLAELIDVDVNVVTVSASGASVDALVVTLLAAAGDPPLAQIRIGHAEVSGVACGGGDVPECSDTADNDGDGVIDAQDPGCHTDGDANNPGSYDPNDDSEASTQCSDTADNDGDGVIDAKDPGCHTDGDATNAASYDATDNDETNGGGPLPKVAGSDVLPNTGGTAETAAAAGLAALAAGLFALRRRVA